ncbi:M24 family metallopeptidase [Chloroflexota bacterium]
MQIFSQAEMKQRTEKLRQEMDRLGIICAVVTSFHSAYYLSGSFQLPWSSWRMFATIVPLKGEPTLVTNLIEDDRAKEQSWISDVRTYIDEENSKRSMARLIGEVLREKGIANTKVGVEEDTIPVVLLKYLQEVAPGCEFVDISDRLDTLRLVKSEEEVELTRKISDLAEIGVKAFMDRLEEGVSEIELSLASVEAMEREHIRMFPGMESFGIMATVNSGLKTLTCHAVSSDRKIQKGELISMNMLPAVMLYCAHLERTLVLGDIPEVIKKPFETYLKAREAGLEMMKPGVRCSDVERAAADVFVKAGYTEYKAAKMGCTGHSFGIMGPLWGREENGEINLYNDRTIIRENMIFSLEPSLSVPGVGGIRHNDTVLITKDGNEFLTEYDRGMINVRK